VEVTIELPDEIAADLAANNGADLPRAVLEAVAVEGYRSGRLTHAQVGRLLGIEHRLDVDAFLKQHDAPLHYDLEDLERDRETFRRLSI
jgi:predicted HTH domain antitoxin